MFIGKPFLPPFIHISLHGKIYRLDVLLFILELYYIYICPYMERGWECARSHGSLLYTPELDLMWLDSSPRFDLRITQYKLDTHVL